MVSWRRAGVLTGFRKKQENRDGAKAAQKIGVMYRVACFNKELRNSTRRAKK